MEQGEGQAEVPAPEPAPVSEEVLGTFGVFQSGANWFFWIAGLSAINSFIILMGGEWSFIIGLGITLVFDAVAREIGGLGFAVAIVLDVIVLLTFVGFGIFARKRHTWAFIVGMVLYSLDGLLFVLFQDWLSVGFHVFALFFIYKGMRAHLALRALALLSEGGLPPPGGKAES